VENEADQYAFNKLIKEQDNEEQRWVMGLSIILVTCSGLLNTKKATNIKQMVHPDIDQRLLNVLQMLNFSSEEAEFYCWHLCSFSIRFFLLKHGITLPTKTYETVQDELNSYLKLLDDIKFGNRS